MITEYIKPDSRSRPFAVVLVVAVSSSSTPCSANYVNFYIYCKYCGFIGLDLCLERQCRCTSRKAYIPCLYWPFSSAHVSSSTGARAKVLNILFAYSICWHVPTDRYIIVTNYYSSVIHLTSPTRSGWCSADLTHYTILSWSSLSQWMNCICLCERAVLARICLATL